MPPTLVEEYNDLREKALALTEKAAAEDRSLTDDEQTELSGLVDQAKGKFGEVEKGKTATALVEKAQGLQALKADGAKHRQAGDPTQPRMTPGDLFIDSAGYKSLLESYPAGIPDSADIHLPPVNLGAIRGSGSKALVYVGDNATAAGSTIPGVPQDFRGFLPPYFYTLTIFDVITRSSTSSELVEYVTEDLTKRVNAAAPVPEAKATSGASYTAAAKPESAVAWIRVASPVRTIATWVPVTTKALADVPQLRSLIDAYLMRFLNETLANQIVNGDGTGENLTGLLILVPTIVPTATTTGFTALRSVLAQVSQYGSPNAWLTSPTDAALMDTQKDGQGRYFGAGPFGSGPQTLWGLPVIASRQVPAGTWVVGDFNQAVLFDREAASVQVGTINDQFTHNMRTLLAEERAAFGVLRPSALGKVAGITFP